MFETEKIAEKVQKKLKDGERLLWCGMSEKGTKLSERGVTPFDGVFPIIIVIAGFSPIVKLYMSGAAEGDDEAKLAAILAAIVIGLIFFVFFLSEMIGSRECYAITDKRVFIMNKQCRMTRCVNIDTLSEVRAEESSRKIGVVKAHRKGYVGGKAPKKHTLMLKGIKEPRKVSIILKDAVDHK